MKSFTIEFTNGHQIAYEAETIMGAIRQAIEDIRSGGTLTGAKIAHIYRPQ